MTHLTRETKETKINLNLLVYGQGESKINTKIGFFDHMLEAFSKHSLSNLELTCDGDIHVDFHHTVEDVGIVLGKALKEEIFPIEKVERFSSKTVILDEAAVEVIIDLSGRPFIHYQVPLEGKIGEFDTELIEEFFRALILNANISAHFILHRGKNKHHIAEATFKAFAVALREALKPNERLKTPPSTKGVL